MKDASFSPVAIIGMGCLFPQARNLAEYWANIKNKVDSITDIPPTHWSSSDYFHKDPKKPDHTYGSKGGFLPTVDFSPLEYGILPNALEATDTSQLLGMVVAKEALEDGGYGSGKEFNRDRVSVILGVTSAMELLIPLGARLGHPIWKKALSESGIEGEAAERIIQRISDGYVGWQEASFPGLLGNVVAGRIANYFNFGGTNCVVDAACASSLSALHLSCMELASGKSDMVLSGGVDTFNDIFMYMCFSKTPALSPMGHARPFDHKGDGTTLGEGIGILLLKRWEEAKRDGDKIYAVIRGIGSSSDGKGQAIYAPSAQGQAKALQRAYSMSGISPDTVELVEAHGTGTRVGDAIEVSALSEVFQATGRKDRWCALGSVKSNIGHTKAAAGVAGVIKAAMALHQKTIPPTLKVEQPLPQISEENSPFYVNTEKRPWSGKEEHPRRAAVSALGFGGSNFHCLLEESSPLKENIDFDGKVQILAFSASSREEIQKELASFEKKTSWEDVRLRAGEGRKKFQSSHPYRLLLTATFEDSLPSLISTAREMMEKNSQKKNWTLPSGIYFGSGKIEGKMAFLFPGQGSQYVAMGRDVFCHFPQALKALQEGDSLFFSLREKKEKRLSDYIYPHPAFREEEKKEQELQLRSTDITQPALGVVSLGMAEILHHFGITPQAVAGHSYGELSALCVAGRISHQDFYHLSCLRGKLMAGSSGEDRGSMLAVQASLAQIEEILKKENLSLVIANKNAPLQSVLSGKTSEIQRAEEIFTRAHLRALRLPVSAAFHSPLVEQAAKPLGEELKKITFQSSSVSVYSNTTGEVYPEDSEEAKNLLSGQLVHPVEFVQEIENLYQGGIRTFVEVGPGGRISSLVQSILSGKEIQTMALDASSGNKSGLLDLGKTLAYLGALGYETRLPLWDANPSLPKSPPKGHITVPLCGANYRSPRKISPKTLPSQEKGKSISSVPSNGKISPPKKDISMDQFIHKKEEIASSSAKNALSSQPSAPSKQPQIESPHPSVLTEALRITQENLVALQKMQEQTSQIHSQYLEGQNKSQNIFQNLFAEQQKLIQNFLGTAPSDSPSAMVALPRFSPAPLLEKEKKKSPSVSVPAPIQRPAETPSPSPVSATTAASRPLASPAQEKTLSGGMETDRIEKALVEVISEKTGYPAEMIQLSMEMDSELGIDSIKRVEIFSALQERLPGAPEVKSQDLGKLKTLQDVVSFLSQNSAPSAASRPSSSQAQEKSLSQIMDRGHLEKTLVEVISEKTGYPAEMIQLSMEMDSELGIDSIKRVEIFSALQERLPGAPEVKSQDLGKLKTLQDVISFLSQNSAPSAASRPSSSQAQEKSLSQIMDRGHLEKTLVEVISEKTGYPAEMIQLSMEMDSELGIDSIKRVEIFSALQERLPGAPEVKSQDLGKLKTLQDVVSFLSLQKEPSSLLEEALSPGEKKNFSSNLKESIPIQRLIPTLEKWKDEITSPALSLPPGARIWITGEESGLAESLQSRLEGLSYQAEIISLEEVEKIHLPSALHGLFILSPREKVSSDFLKKAFHLLQKVSFLLQESSRHHQGFFCTVSRMDGTFGFENFPSDSSPLSGGLSGLLKTAAQEWSQIHARALDLPWEMEKEKACEKILENFLLQGPLEIGIAENHKTKINLSSCPLSESSSSFSFPQDGTILITGGARGVTAHCALALARAIPSTFILLGRTELQEEQDWLQALEKESEIKKGLFAHHGKMTPKAMEEEVQKILSQREIRENLKKMKDAGARAFYRTTNICNEEEVQSLLQEISVYGPVRGLVHGAGVIHDRLIEDKTLESFDKVYDTKIKSLFYLLNSLSLPDLKLLIFFSSTTARYGRKGQSDYAIANEVLNKTAQMYSRSLPGCKVLSLNWGPWDGGMVTTSLKKVFEKEGVPLIGKEEGALYLVQELCQPQSPVEIVILGTDALSSEKEISPKEEKKEMVPSYNLSFQQNISLSSHPFLTSHVLQGNPVIPAAMQMEWMAEGALHSNPGLKFSGLRNFRILKGIVLKEEVYPLSINNAKARKEGTFFAVPMEISGKNKKGEKILHCQTEILLSREILASHEPLSKPHLSAYPCDREEIYLQKLFHGPHFQALLEVTGWSEEGITARSRMAPDPSEWMEKPFRKTWVLNPLAVDVSFQMMILWSLEQYSIPSLPCRVGQYWQYKDFSSPVEIRIRTLSHNDKKAISSIEFLDSQENLVAEMKDYECTIYEGLKEGFRENHILK